ncbi:MAG: hypothetical protein ACOZBW_13505 [Thermodesulfobacteriota bacterium]
MRWISPNRDPSGPLFLFSATFKTFLKNFAGPGLVLLLLVPVAAFPSLAQGPAIEVRQVSPGLVDAEPGKILSFAFRVTNRSDVRVPVRETVELPDGWRLVMPLLDLELEPGESVTRMVVVQVSRAAPAGEYEFLYAATGRDDYGLADRAEARVAVMPVYGLVLQVEDRPPDRMVAGESVTFRARLLNQGNSDMAVTMETKFTNNGRAVITPDAFRLPPGASQVLEISATADPGEDRLRRSHVAITARTDQTVSGRPVGARLSLPVDVVPLAAGQDMYYRYPLKLFSRLGGDDNGSAMQFGLQGNGFVDEGRQRHLEFLVQAPDRHEESALGRRDEYWLRYKESFLSVKAGDQSYGLSELTSWYRYGRGAGADLFPTDSPAGAGVYYVEDRWTSQQRNDTGAYIAFTPRPETTVRVNYLDLDYEAWQTEPAARDTIFSLQGETDLLFAHHLEAEAAFSDTGRQDAESDEAWRMELRSPKGGSVRYDLSGRRAEPDYAGRYPDSASYTGSASFPVVPGLRANTYYGRYERNLDKDPLKITAPRENLYRAGLDAQLPYRWYASVDYDHYDREDGLPVPTYRFAEHGVTLGAGRTTDRYGYRAEARRGWTEDRLTGDDYGGWNYSLYGTLNPHQNFFLSAFTTFGDDNSPGESRLLRRGRSYGGTLRWTPGRSFSAWVNFSRNDQTFPDEPLRERVETDYWSAGLNWKSARGQTLEVSARRSDGNHRDADTSYFVTWTLPFDMPLGRKKSVGALTGRVFRADQPEGPGVAGAVVYVDGTAAVTDSDGRFVFRTLKPTTYEVRVDDRSIGIDSVPAVVGPIAMSVNGGKTTTGDIALTASGSLSGKVALAKVSGANGHTGGNGTNGTHVVGSGTNGNGHHDEEEMLNPSEGLANILVELSRPEDTRRTVTDANGNFLFQRLLPGTWTLKVYTHNLPAQHVLEKERQVIVIDPGTQAQATVNVVPRLREIKFIDTGRIGPVSRR